MPVGGGKRRGGTRKHGRNKAWCVIYQKRNKREKNKLRKLIKLFKNHPKDKTLKGAIRKYREVLCLKTK